MDIPLPGSIELLKKLVSFETVSSRSNLTLIEFVRDYLADFGVDSQVVFDEYGAKANLYATIGPSDVPGIMLSGHSDVVPVDNQDWSSDPFVAVARNDRLYGRGVCDMKAFPAAVLTLLPEIIQRGLKTPLHLALSYDEEVGCIGGARLARQLTSSPVRPALCIVGEPTNMSVGTKHKGKRISRCCVTGQEGHSSDPRKGVNAIEAASMIIGQLARIARRFHDAGPHDEDLDPPYTIIQTGTINGGTSINVIPNSCIFEFEIRHLADNGPNEILREVQTFAEDTIIPAMHRVSSMAGISFETIAEYPGLATSEAAEVVQLTKALSENNGVVSVPYGCEAGLFHEAGIPTVICGPGSIEQAHRPDEFISFDQINRCERFLDRLKDHVCHDL